MAKRNKCDECRWEPTGKKRHPWECSMCGDVFPCKNKDCGHIDCHEESPRTCHVCDKKIYSGDTLYFLDGQGVDMYAVHKGCAEADCVVRTYEQ